MSPTPTHRAATLTALLAPLLLAACAVGPAPRAPSLPTAAAAPSAWQAPAPQAAFDEAPAPADGARRGWRQFDDPVLDALQAAAQQASPSVAAARTRIAQARATRVAAGAALGPTLDATAAASRGRQDLSAPLNTAASVGLQAAWELDLFGANGAARDAAQARLEGARAGWHDARVSVDAETALAYLDLRACEAQLAPTRSDAASRAETARLTGLAAKAGFQSPANAALARASAAQGQASLTQQLAACDRAVKGLVVLTGLDEPALRERLAAGTGTLPRPARLDVAAVPAEALNQRPDIAAAARELVAASAEVSLAEAQRLPRIALSGQIGAARVSTSAATLDGTVWSLGPLSVSLPIFDGGRRRAQVDAAQARHDEAVSAYAARLRTAVREVEDALVALQSTAARSADAQVATEGFEASYRATEARQRGGLASLFELEDARRSALQAQSALIELQRERVAAWIALYRALGGGWAADDLSTPADLASR